MENDTYENMPDAVINLLKLPVKIALASFAIGTFLLLLFFIASEKDPIIILGVWYVMLAVIINSSALLVFIVLSFRYPAYQWYIIRRACMMLINIPIAYLYMMCVAKFTFG